MTGRARGEEGQGRHARVHRALGDPSRVRLLSALRSSEGPLDATQLADRVGLHPNTVRSHLRLLEEAGLARSEPEERHTRGRPRIVYSATPDGSAAEDPTGYRMLAEIFASYLAAQGEDSAARAGQAGQRWGRLLVDRLPPFQPRSASDEVQTVVKLLSEFGFEPTVKRDPRGHTVLMQHCPFGTMTDEYRQVVCAVHLGLIQGALDELGAHVEADDLQPFVQPGVCAAHLETVDAV
jgi:predicted ArsR family transcriptional regulator